MAESTNRHRRSRSLVWRAVRVVAVAESGSSLTEIGILNAGRILGRIG
ncbi:hypothetical protein ACHMZP_32920 [Rhodococcus baikonurensis]